MPAAAPIRDKNKLRQLAEHFLKRDQTRNYTLIVLGVHTALRISDLLGLSWDSVYDERSRDFRTHIVITEKKTKKEKTIRLQPLCSITLIFHAVNISGPRRGRILEVFKAFR